VPVRKARGASKSLGGPKSIGRLVVPRTIPEEATSPSTQSLDGAATGPLATAPTPIAPDPSVSFPALQPPEDTVEDPPQ
jgi:hypothetical protein